MENIVKAIEISKKILITTHVNPDGDAIGSGLALILAINKINVEREKIARFAIDDDIPSFLKFLPHSELIENIKYLDKSEKYDLIISLDSASSERIGISYSMKNSNNLLINIDHHISNENFGDINYIDKDAAATAEIIFKLIKFMKIEINQDIATALYCGIISDTGNFSFDNVTYSTFEAAAELKKIGISIEKISENIFRKKSFQRLKMLALAIEKMVYIEDKKIVYSYITLEEMKKLGAIKEDSEGIVETLKNLDKCDIALFLREDDNNTIKGSLRSKNKNVDNIASIFGGGGHCKAAGFNTKLKFEEIIKKILETL